VAETSVHSHSVRDQTLAGMDWCILGRKVDTGRRGREEAGMVACAALARV